jgi:hypothetical protein
MKEYVSVSDGLNAPESWPAHSVDCAVHWRL